MNFLCCGWLKAVNNFTEGRRCRSRKVKAISYDISLNIIDYALILFS